MWCSPNDYPEEYLVGSRLGHYANRAWILQEYLLAPRILEFTYQQAQWACLSHQGSEVVQSTTEIDPVSSDDFHWELLHPEIDSDTALRLWYKVVDSYSWKKLSYKSDKLPALSGIAQKFQAMTGRVLGEYLAGIWETDLAWQLCWYSGLGSKRSKDYRAPSWSWTCKDGYYYNTFIGEDDKPDILFECVKAETFPILSPYGPVHGGYIHVRGKMCEMFISRHDNWNERNWDVSIEILDMLFSSFQSITDDDLTEWQRSLGDGRTFYALPICSRTRKETRPIRSRSPSRSSLDEPISTTSHDVLQHEAAPSNASSPMLSPRSLSDSSSRREQFAIEETLQLNSDDNSNSVSSNESAIDFEAVALEDQDVDNRGKRREANWRQHLFALEDPTKLDIMILEATGEQRGQYRRVGVFSSTRLQHRQYLEEAFATSNLEANLYLEEKDEKDRYMIEIV
ncbi:hypothetical protein H2198_003554 [Neophaeococcomyces mojaviensis]|uniref:Uncharacterized protein n=1 Tax=Neophaeococcomyces mojaviensis TaxID=3383035 RepID=A0ACC3ABI1_9EURO|nr:hypothetical protein H2198_003554 [Knufia sp. JES_112]